MNKLWPNIRPNLAGDFPEIHPSALIDPSAQIIGKVRINKNVFVGPLSVIRADERGAEGFVAPITLDEEVNVQDGVIIHSQSGEIVEIGAKTSVAHGATIHGPCKIGMGCFLAMRCVLYSADLENHVWVGMGAKVMKTALASHTYVPAGSVIKSIPDTWNLRVVSTKEKAYIDDVLARAASLREDYRKLAGIEAP
jgi:carbonic anhydrase/acetyltransferase-like protein (isoleucine patch superfamily)